MCSMHNKFLIGSVCRANHSVPSLPSLGTSRAWLKGVDHFACPRLAPKICIFHGAVMYWNLQSELIKVIMIMISLLVYFNLHTIEWIIQLMRIRVTIHLPLKTPHHLISKLECCSIKINCFFFFMELCRQQFYNYKSIFYFVIRYVVAIRPETVE